MQYSQFQWAVNYVYGSGLGQSYLRDLYLPAFQSTAEQALARGVEPREVWVQILAETGMPEDLANIHLWDQKSLNALKTRHADFN